MNWPEALFGSIAAVCAAIVVLALVFGDRINEEKDQDQ